MSAPYNADQTTLETADASVVNELIRVQATLAELACAMEFASDIGSGDSDAYRVLPMRVRHIVDLLTKAVAHA